MRYLIILLLIGLCGCSRPDRIDFLRLDMVEYVQKVTAPLYEYAWDSLNLKSKVRSLERRIAELEKQ